MAHRNAHMETSRRLLGREFPEVHVFLDQFFQVYHLGHRPLLHHQRGIELVVERFGEEAREAAELHIVEDLAQATPDENWRDLRKYIPESWGDYGEPLFLDLALFDQFERELRELYGEEDDSDTKAENP